MSRCLAFDLGRSACRVAVCDDGRRVAAAQVASRGTLTDPDGDEAVLATLAAATDLLDDAAADVSAVAAGIAGAGGRRDRAGVVAAHLARRHRAPAGVTSDVVAAHAGALGGRAGVVVAAGTGAVAYGVGADGRVARVDGWGYLLGDDGSGFAVGRAGLAAALRAVDGRGAATPLVALAEARYGPLEDLPRVVHTAADPGRLIAAFAPDVAAAARQGDAVARGIWDAAVAALARAAAAAARVVAAPVPVSWTGGLFALDDLVTAPFRARVVAADPRAEPRPPLGDALDGAARLAVDPATPLEGQVSRAAP